jgi:hypothetical protein
VLAFVACCTAVGVALHRVALARTRVAVPVPG